MSPRRGGRKAGLALVVGVVLVVGACSGGGGGERPAGVLLAISFVEFPNASGGATGTGPNAGVPLPEVFLDQALELRFDAPITDGIFGGFFVDPASGQPPIFHGASGDGQGDIPYFAYADQLAAAQSLQILWNDHGAQQPFYVVGRHRDAADVIVVDPVSSASGSIGSNQGVSYPVEAECVIHIPQGNGILVGGVAARPVGPGPSALPLVYPPGTPLPSPSPLFRSGSTLAPDSDPPEVLSITLASGAAGTVADPAWVDDSIVVTFSKRIDVLSADVLDNFVVFNADLGVIVPGHHVAQGWSDPKAAIFTPIPGYGPGHDPAGGIGYSIEVRVGSFGQPPEIIPPIVGLPTGTAPGSQLPLANSLSFNFVTVPAPGAPGALTVVERFDADDQQDMAFVPSFAPVVWGSGPTHSGQLLGQPISGSPLATFASGLPNSPELGTRVQVTVTPQPLGTLPGPGPGGLISPFDDKWGGCLGPLCTNPLGGAHIMHGYEAVDLANTRSSIELVEWGPVQNFVQGTVYPQYQAWCGMTSYAFPMSPLTGGVYPGLVPIFHGNYDLPTNQPLDPAGQGGVQTTPGPMPYSTGAGGLTPSGYFPFPVFTEPFDYIGSGPGQGNLVLEMNIEHGPQLANFNRFRSSANQPRRRLVGTSLSDGNAAAFAAGFDIYDMRFTFVTMESQGQSLFYDSGVPAGASPIYTDFTLSPSPFYQPPGTRAHWELEGAAALIGPGTPAPGQSTGFQTLFDGDSATGSYSHGALAAINGHRFFRYRVTLRNENLSNTNQAYDSMIMGISF